ncbi:MAG: hypothetical protein AVO34_01190 [Firmicutes bacterium ML8_F2]|jgi:uncharacterized protein|nr:MAG: hypothetical protein AVO34_01190 [Firmicutes bacterium ML8_F2]
MSSRRIYRHEGSGPRLTSFTVAVKESDLWIAVNSSFYKDSLQERTEHFLWRIRRSLESYLAVYPNIVESLEPCLLEEDAPWILRRMTEAANRAGVGPMAAVAGAVAESVGTMLLEFSPEVIVENGGDIFLKADAPVTVGIYAGRSPLSGKLGLKINPSRTPLGICTSSGKVGPSLSFGRADAAVVAAVSAPLADAAATAVGNMVTSPADFSHAVGFMRSITGVSGLLLICGDKMTVWGDMELQPLKS